MKKQQFVAIILAGVFCFSLLSCSKQEKTQASADEGEQKSLVKLKGQSALSREKQSPKTDTSLSPTGQDSLAEAFEPIPAPFGFIHKNSIQYYSKAFVREAYFNVHQRGVSQEEFSKHYDNWVRHEFYLNLPDRNLLLARHYWLGEMDIPNGVITFWQPQGDSLRFIPLEGKSYLNSWSDSTISDSMSYAGGALVLVLNSWAGDAGDIWGYYDVLRLQKNNPIKLLAHENYEYSNVDDNFDANAKEDSTTVDYTTLKCEIVREEKTALKVRYIRDAFAIINYASQHLIKSDTSFATFH